MRARGLSGICQCARATHTTSVYQEPGAVVKGEAEAAARYGSVVLVGGAREMGGAHDGTTHMKPDRLCLAAIEVVPSRGRARL